MQQATGMITLAKSWRPVEEKEWPIPCLLAQQSWLSHLPEPERENKAEQSSDFILDLKLNDHDFSSEALLIHWFSQSFTGLH